MINLFDLSAGASSKVVTRDGSPVRRNQPGPKESVDVKIVTGHMSRSSLDKKAGGGGGTPIKMLIMQEMVKEGETNQKTTSVVARLMGLDGDLPPPKPTVPSNSRTLPDGHLSTTSGRDDNQMPFEKCASFGENVEYKDVYEVGYQPPRSEHFSNESSQKGRWHEDEKRRMDLVRQKFVEAKRLASDEKLLQSKEFHDALEVLSSNKDLFLKFLEEPNSLFAKQSVEFHSAPTSPQRRRITVLKPSKSVGMKDEKTIRRQQNQTVRGSRAQRCDLHRKSSAGHDKAERLPQHTQIVVLKPTSAITFVENFEQNGHDSLGGSEAAVRSRHLSDDINWPVSGMYHQHEESLAGCVQSNAFSRDGSYLNRSDYTYVEEEDSGFSESEIETPTSRHSWDYIYRFSNPYFGSSLSHASCSPESHITTEAKKHTSQRWVIASSNDIGQEKVPVRRSLSTLGEMLAMPDGKKEDIADGVATDASKRTCGDEPSIRLPFTCSVSDGDGESSLRKISRSKSVPVSSSAFDNLCIDPQHKETQMPKEEVKHKNGKSSLKGKISSFFSSRRKKAGKEKLSPSPLVCLNERVLTDENLEEKFDNPRVNVPVSQPETPSSSKAPNSLEKVLSFEAQNYHFDQPSPTSVLDAPFDDANEKSPSSSQSAIPTKQEPLSRSLPIGSIARALSWDCSTQEASLSNTKADGCEQEQYHFIEKVLSYAGFSNEKTNIFVGWHSLDSAMGPTVLNKFLERKVEDAKSRERRSNHRLLFDSINAALLEIGQNELWGAYPSTEPHVGAQRTASCDVLVTDEVWRLVRNWLLNNEMHLINETNNVSYIADLVVFKEISGKGWSKSVRLELDEISMEICGEVLDELVGEAFSGFAVGFH